MNFRRGVVQEAIYGHTDDDEMEATIMLMEENKRNWKWKYDRLDWTEHVAQQLHTNKFQSKYHMSLAAFNDLVELLRQDITVDFNTSRLSTEGNDPIYPKLVLAAGLRFLGGTKHKDLGDIIGCSTASARRVVSMFTSAVLDL